jgi:hypothetical protein
MNTLKSILRTAAGVALGIIGALFLYVVVINVLDRMWMKNLDGRAVVTRTRDGVKTTTLEYIPDKVFGSVSAADTLETSPVDSTQTVK